MPANLPPEAKAKWNEALAAKNPREKVRLFQEFLSEIPEHKGNERLRAQTKSKIATLKEEIVAQRGKRGGSRSAWSVEREGGAQVMIFGPTNAGRSSLLRALTNAQPAVATYEYTTQLPVPGMLEYEDIQFQLVELPAPQAGNDGVLEIQPEAVDLIRNADGLMIVLDLTAEPARQLRAVMAALEEVRISIQRPSTRVEVVREKGAGEIRIATSGSFAHIETEKIRALLHSYGIKNALVRIYGNAALSDVEDAILENVTLYKPCLVICNKSDLVQSSNLPLGLPDGIEESVRVTMTSCLIGTGLERVGGLLFHCLGIIRVYTKEPGQSKTSERPFVVKVGTTVGDLARAIHSDLANKYRYSRIWGPTSKFAGERVGPEHVLGDLDVVEIHAE